MLLTDIVMPEMDGIEVWARPRLGARSRHPRIMFITGFAAVAPPTRIRRRRRMPRCCRKPVHLRELVSEVNKNAGPPDFARPRSRAKPPCLPAFGADIRTQPVVQGP